MIKNSNPTKKPKWLKQIPPRIGYYFAGFIDGEGSFNVSMRRKDDYRVNWQVVLTFNVSQRDKVILSLLKRYLGCGRLQERKDGVYYYIVANPRALIERVIPFFKRFPFLSAKMKKNFSIFQHIARLVYQGKHLEPEGLREILKLREKLNKGRGRKRKYNINDFPYQKILRDYKRRTERISS
jgi:hypothetical protein